MSQKKTTKVTVNDVAQYILKLTGKISTWKLQKLVYYSQAWHLVWEDEHLFSEKIEAWANGPVCRKLYNIHKGDFYISDVLGDIRRLTDDQKDTIKRVVKFYRKFNGQQLSDLTHAEDPWKKARKGLSDNKRGSSEISRESMSEYYSSLAKSA